MSPTYPHSYRSGMGPHASASSATLLVAPVLARSHGELWSAGLGPVDSLLLSSEVLSLHERFE